MAQLAIPLIGAGLGFAVFETTFAMSVGWLIGSWIYSAFMMEGNEVFDPGAEEMPRINQSLRGVTMPVMFGTNRVTPNIVWTKNFTPIRQESDGGGSKGGGSGSKGGGPTSVSYEYRMDILYHFGMVPEPYTIFRGWVYADVMTDDTVLAILQGNGNYWVAPEGTENGPVSLNFDDSFFFPGGDTGDLFFTNWPHFETSEGVGTRWPHTVAVGFQQLSLGGSTSIPQLSFEIGPGEYDLQFSAAEIEDYTSPSYNPNPPAGNNGFVIGGNNKRYHVSNIESTGGSVFRLVNVDDGTALELSFTDFNTDAGTLGFGTGYGSDKIALPIQDTPYVVFLLAKSDAGGTKWAGILYEINASGAFVAHKGFGWRHSDGANNFGTILAVGRAKEQTDSDEIVFAAQFAGDTVYVVSLPSLNDMKNLAQNENSPNTSFENRMVSLGSDLAGLGSNNVNGHVNFGLGCFLPTATIILPPTITWGTRFLFYVSKNCVEWHNDNTGDPSAVQHILDNRVAYPNGWIAYQGITITAGVPTLTGSLTIDNSILGDAFPFDDAGTHYDGTADANAIPDYVGAIGTSKLDDVAYGWLMTFAKYFNLQADHPNTGLTTTSIRGFVWNPFTKTGQQVFSRKLAQADLPLTGSIDPWEWNALNVFYDQTNNDIVLAAYGDGTGRYHSYGGLGGVDIGGGSDVTPPYIIYKLLTNTVYGMSIDPDLISYASYLNAVAFCEANAIKVSVLYTRDDNFLNVINELLALYGGYLTESGGTIKFGVVELSSTPVRTIDNDHLLIEDDKEPPVTITRPARQDTANVIKVNYFDRELYYRQNQYEIADEVDIDLNGVRVKEFPAKFVMTEETAAKIAARALWSNLYGRDIHDFKLGWKDGDLEPGDVITLVDSHHDELSTGRKVRIVSWKENSPGVFQARAVSEIDYISSSSAAFYSVTSAQPVRDILDAAMPPLDFRAYELPREFQGADAKIFFGYNQAMTTRGAFLYLSADDVSYALTDQVEPYIISGMFPEALPNRPVGYCEQDLTIYLMPSSGFNANTPTYAQTHGLDDFTQALRAAGGAVLIAGSEAMSAQGLTLLAQNKYKVDKLWRGWGGTAIQAHNSGAYWHRHSTGIFNQTINADKIGSIIYYKVVPYNFRNEAANVSSIAGKSWTVQGTYFRPQTMPRIRTFIESPISGTASEDLLSKVTRQVTSGGCDITFTWPDQAWLEGFGAGGFGAQGFGHFAQDTSSHAYQVQILSSDMSTVVRCLSVGTGFYTYSLETNSADFNGWTGQFAVRVLPYNNYGGALASRTQSLALFF